MIKFLVCLTFICCTVLVYSDVCPPTSKIAPCTCDSDEGKISISCVHPDIQSIYWAIDEMSKIPLTVDLIQISCTGALSLRKNIFGSLVVKGAELELENLKCVNYYSFLNQEYNLEFLSIQGSKLSQIPIYAMTSLTMLENLEIVKSGEIQVVESNMFKPMSRASGIKKVRFFGNQIEIVEKYAFFELTHLEILDLRDNKIVELFLVSMPLKLSQLKNFILWDNTIDEFPSHLIKRMPNGSELGLYNNNIVNITSEDLKLILNKEISVDLGANKVYCGCEFGVIAKSNDLGKVLKISGYCDKPERLYGKDFKILHQNDFKECS